VTSAMLDRGTSKTPAKRGDRRHVDARGIAFGWPDVLRALAPLESRQRVLGAVKAAGFSPDSWGSRASLQALADALTRAEDSPELAHRGRVRDRERATLRDLRRRLELELWP
jgi:hypothetical protein